MKSKSNKKNLADQKLKKLSTNKIRPRCKGPATTKSNKIAPNAEAKESDQLISNEHRRKSNARCQQKHWPKPMRTKYKRNVTKTRENMPAGTVSKRFGLNANGKEPTNGSSKETDPNDSGNSQPEPT